MTAWLPLGLLLIAGLALVINHDAGTVAGLSNADFAGIMTGLALLMWIGGGFLSRGEARRGTASQTARDVVTWIALALVLVTGYTYREDLKAVWQRVAQELSPSGTAFIADGQSGPEVRLRRDGDGHFHARITMNGVSIPTIVDTGASTVVLTVRDAARIGLNVEDLRYTAPVSTANGTTMAAPVTLPEVVIGAVRIERVRALVARDGALEKSLLGMSFLSRLRSYEFAGDYLTLRG